MQGTLAHLIAQFSQDGRVDWIGVRPKRKHDLLDVPSVSVKDFGLEGDHRTKPGKRAVTLIQAEHLPVIAALSNHEEIHPALLRRNIVVSGINLLGLRNRRFQIGSVVLEGTGLCAPCSRMEEVLGKGGYTAMRGHGGITATVIQQGQISLGDAVSPLLDYSE